MTMKLVKKIIYKIKNHNLDVSVSDLEFEKSAQKWFSDEGDKNHRLNYDFLTPESVVFDLGGYEGQWGSDIFSKYNCQILIFEPYIPFYNNIKIRFKNNSKIKAFPFGLGASNYNTKIYFNNDGTSLFEKKGNAVNVEIKEIQQFLKDLDIEHIHLMKINIEGGEYELLETVIDSNIINIIQNIQVQFHNKYVENPEKRMEEIQKKLEKTHKLSWQYKFVWENWEFK